MIKFRDKVITHIPRETYMPKDLLVRNVSDELVSLLESKLAPADSMNNLLKKVLWKGAEAISPAASLEEGDADFTFIDLFAGIGGFHLGMRANGGKCVYSSEWDKYAATTYGAWFHGHKIDNRDIRTIDIKSEIPKHDVLLAGFPCQPFSIAGVSKKNSMGRTHGFEDEKQGNLFFAIAQIAQERKPPVMILENVKNLKSHDKGNTWQVIQNILDESGYEIFHKVIDARHWVPQHRERIFIVCFRRGSFLKREIAQFQFSDPPNAAPKLKSILSRVAPDSKYMLTDGLWAYLQAYAAKHKAQGNGFGYQRVGPNDVARTMSARYYKDGSEILIDQPEWSNPRRLTPTEAAKLMGFNSRFSKTLGFPRGFPQVVSDTQAYKQFGNSVSPLVVEWVGKDVKKIIDLRTQRLGRTNSAKSK